MRSWTGLRAGHTREVPIFRFICRKMLSNLRIITSRLSSCSHFVSCWCLEALNFPVFSGVRIIIIIITIIIIIDTVLFYFLYNLYQVQY